VHSVRSAVSLFLAPRAESAITKPSESSTPPAPLDLPGYIAELERWSASADRLRDHPEKADALRTQLPDSWLVVVEEQRFSVSTRPLGAAIDRIIRDPSTVAGSAREISDRVESLLADARAMSRTSARDYAPAHARLDQILKRHEFRFVRRDTEPETFWDQLLDRLWEWVAGLLNRAGNHPKVTNFLRWGILFGLGLVLLVWVAYTLTHASYQRSPVPAGDALPREASFARRYGCSMARQ